MNTDPDSRDCIRVEIARPLSVNGCMNTDLDPATVSYWVSLYRRFANCEEPF